MSFNKSVVCLIGFFTFSPLFASVQSYFEQIKSNPIALYQFFKSMPKGGELHYHLAGGPYPETMLELTFKDNYCLDSTTLIMTKSNTSCTGLNTTDLPNQPELYAKLVRSWSMKDFVPGAESGHDHFFNSFLKFSQVIFDHRPELVADVVRRAALQQEHYLELMILPDNGNSISFGKTLQSDSSLAQKRQTLLANPEFQKNITHTAEETERVLSKTRDLLGCQANPQADNCQVQLNFLYYSLREQPFESLFAQTLNAFEAGTQSQNQGGHLVGVNLVQAEDGMVSLRDYHKQMQMYQYFHEVYPKVNIALHAGELAHGLVVPEALTYHIYDALMTGQAQRIGHGVDITYENNAKDILKLMATQHKAVEINLISNLKILGVAGANHPLNYYLEHQVPVVLSTDDEGVLRTDLTTQYVTAVQDHGVDYPTIKQINRNALTYSFSPGKSIWANADNASLVTECRDLQSVSCDKFIKENKKAQLQWNLEQKLSAFEGKY